MSDLREIQKPSAVSALAAGMPMGMEGDPADSVIEAAVLGALLVNHKRVGLVVDLLKPYHFFWDAYGRLYAEMVRRYVGGEAFDALTMADWVSDAGLFEDDSELFKTKEQSRTVAARELGNLVCAAASHLMLPAYARHITDLYLRRLHIEFARELSKAAQRAESVSVLDEVMRHGIAVVAKELTRTGISDADASEAVRDTLSRMDEISMSQTGLVGLSTGFECLDMKYGGLEGGTLHLIAGRPGMGKSALMVQLALRMSAGWRPRRDVYGNWVGWERGQGTRVRIVSLEMSKEQIIRRMFSVVSGISLSKLRSGSVLHNVRDAGALFEVSKTIRDLPFTICDVPGQTVEDIAAGVSAQVNRGEAPGVVIIDHLHHVAKTGRHSNEAEAYAHITASLKGLAKLHNIPVILLAQLNRDVEKRADKRPVLADLRASGSIEQDADTVMFLYRDGYYADKSAGTPEEEEAEFIFAKVRDGETGVARMKWHGRLTKFSEPSTRDL